PGISKAGRLMRHTPATNMRDCSTRGHATVVSLTRAASPASLAARLLRHRLVFLNSMSNFIKLFFLTALLAAVCAHNAHADKKTVCSITVNSPDEKEAFRRSLPSNKYQFVELVERGRSDWLESACRQGIRCDVLVIS